jgi:hypothetical protein
MGLKVTIDNARPIDTGIWKASLKPEEAATFGDCNSKVGPFTVLFLEAIVDFNERSQCLTFDPGAVRLLNLGTTDELIILGQEASQTAATPHTNDAPAKTPRPRTEPPPLSPAPKPASTTPETPEPVQARSQAPEYELSQALATGDKLFLSELPPELRTMGERLLSVIREHFHGELTYEPRFAKFDETPEIFWTVKILPQENALRLTVRGTPEDFKNIKGVDVKLDKFGYSKFTLSHKGQIPAALECIKQAAKIMLES